MNALGGAYHFDCFKCSGSCGKLIRDGSFFPLTVKQRQIMLAQLRPTQQPAPAKQEKDDEDEDPTKVRLLPRLPFRLLTVALNFVSVACLLYGAVSVLSHVLS
jgi:hypothetical protein